MAENPDFYNSNYSNTLLPLRPPTLTHTPRNIFISGLLLLSLEATTTEKKKHDTTHPPARWAVSLS